LSPQRRQKLKDDLGLPDNYGVSDDDADGENAPFSIKSRAENCAGFP
jgi:hypothetical protein